MVWLLLRGRVAMGPETRFDDRFRYRLPRICAASAFMGLVLWAVAGATQDAFAMRGIRYAALIALILVGGISYFGAGHTIGAFRLAEFKAALRRNR
jgi:putative peptidoglycan lipid II flippase